MSEAKSNTRVLKVALRAGARSWERSRMGKENKVERLAMHGARIY